MKVKANPRYEVFLSELAKTKRCFSPWEGIAFRAAHLEFARVAKILDGLGALRFGGRWSAPGRFRAVNLSLSQETAIQECRANGAYYKFPPIDLRPRIVVAVRLRLENVIDLVRRNGVAKQSGLRLGELLADDWRKFNDAGQESQSQALGRAAYDLGAAALLVPSVRAPGGANIVLFPELMPGSDWEILGQEDLPKWLRKK